MLHDNNQTVWLHTSPMSECTLTTCRRRHASQSHELYHVIDACVVPVLLQIRIFPVTTATLRMYMHMPIQRGINLDAIQSKNA